MESTHYYGDSCQPPHTEHPDNHQEEILADLAKHVERHELVKSDTYGVETPEQAAEALFAMLGWSTSLSDHTRRTPERFVAYLREMLTPEDFAFTTFPTESDEMITVGPIPFYTLCAHHAAPFFGNVWLGYVPKDEICGLSKIPRLVRATARGPWVQEDFTSDLAESFTHNMDNQGVAVLVKAEHLCMAMRGVKQPGVTTTTSKMTGVFADHNRTAKAEFMEWTRHG
jgi:GTP cyclohydrolase IA